MSNELYARRDTESDQLGPLYMKHLAAMTSESLHSKSHIAAELAFRDAELAKVTAERDKLQQFKDYVHKRLDDAGVPVDPESPHKAKGCRIGGRLDVLIGERDERPYELLARLRDAVVGLKSADILCQPCFCGYPRPERWPLDQHTQRCSKVRAVLLRINALAAAKPAEIVLTGPEDCKGFYSRPECPLKKCPQPGECFQSGYCAKAVAKGGSGEKGSP